jgi:tetratricopeptide (TPR) repeat protein
MPSIAQLEKLLKLEPNDPFVLYGLAQEHAKAGDVANAVMYYDRCLTADPNYCYAYYHKAKALADNGQTSEAVTTLDSGISIAKKVQDAKALSEMQGLLDSIT